MKRKYRVFKLMRVYDDVEMILRNIPPQTESTYQPDLQRIVVPIPKTEEERIAQGLISEIKKFAPEFLERSKFSIEGFAVDPDSRSLTQIIILLSLEDYQKLGSPTLEETMELTLTKSNEGGD